MENKCLIYFGRFSPFTKGHLKACNEAFNNVNIPIFIICSKGKERDARKPFSVDLRKSIFEDLLKNENIFCGYVIESVNADIAKLTNLVRSKGFEPMGWVFGEDQKSFANQIKFLKDNNLSEDFKMIQVERSSEDISASEARGYLISEDFESFSQITPSYVSVKFYELQAELLETLKEGSIPFEKEFQEISLKMPKNISEKDLNFLKSEIEKVFEESVYFELSTTYNQNANTIGSIDDSDPNYHKTLQRVKNILISNMMEEWLKELFVKKNIPFNQLEYVKDLFLKGFVGDSEDLLKMRNKGVFKISNIDLSFGFDTTNIDAYFSKYFPSDFMNSLKPLKIATQPTMGAMELYFSLFTDYSKPPQGIKGDLYNTSTKKLIEIKSFGGRLGSQDSTNNGIKSKETFYGIFTTTKNLMPIEDTTIGWTKSAYLISQKLFLDHLDILQNLENIENIINCLKNYTEIKTTEDMRKILKEKSKKSTNWFSSYIGAIHLYCYTSKHKISEMIFCTQKFNKIICYKGTTFLDAFNFVVSYLNIQAGWGGKSNNEKVGVVSEYLG